MRSGDDTGGNLELAQRIVLTCDVDVAIPVGRADIIAAVVHGCVHGRHRNHFLHIVADGRIEFAQVGLVEEIDNGGLAHGYRQMGMCRGTNRIRENEDRR